jgi:hypothetical protein
MQGRILSVHEIYEIERGYSHGAPTLGFAANALIERWSFGLRDEETLLRLIFLRWFRITEPPMLTGLSEDGTNEHSVETLINEFGGESKLTGEARFVIALLGHGSYAFGLGNEAEWQERSRRFFIESTELNPESRLFSEWEYLIGEREDSRNLKTLIEKEIHARFNGRGYMGEYLTHILQGMLRPNRVF